MSVLILAGCSGNKNETLPATSHQAPPPIAIQDSLLTSPFGRPRPLGGQATAQNPNTADTNTARSDEQLQRLRKLPQLSRMSEQDLFKLRNQLRQKSLSQRPFLLKNYTALAGLPTQQQELLLAQLADVMPDATPAMRVACTCKSGPKHEMCIKEECGETSALSMMCEALCGPANISSTSCMPSTQCTDK
jgi:hypothetical protein